MLLPRQRRRPVVQENVSLLGRRVCLVGLRKFLDCRENRAVNRDARIADLPGMLTIRIVRHVYEML